MPRILAPGQIEASGQRAIPRIRLPEGNGPFAGRAERLRQLAASGGQAIGDYLRLMAHLAQAQHQALAGFEAPGPDAAQVARSRTHGMPVIHASGWPRSPEWRALALRLCSEVVAGAGAGAPVKEVLQRLHAWEAQQLEAQADALLAERADAIEPAAAPFLMAALQVYWVALASRLRAEDLAPLGTPAVCPSCGCAPVASIVRSDERSQGHRYLHCGLCATEWHLVRVTCSYCQSTANIAYHTIEGGSQAIRAESCDQCHTYRKILYQEQDTAVEPVADDLASLALDLLMSEAGYHRASGNPLLWHRAAEAAPLMA